MLQNVVWAVCGTDPQLGTEWYELLGRSAPNPEDAEWAALVERITAVATNAGVPAEGLLDLLAQHDPTESQAAIAAILWPEAGAGADPAGAEQEEDQAAWNDYLLTNGPSWDGSPASWPAFVEWFVYHADEQSVGTSARLFCAYAAENDARAVFAQYGVTIGLAEPAQPSADAAEPMAVDEAVATFGPKLYAEFRASNPELAHMTDDELSAVLAELLHGQAAMPAPAAS